MSETLTRHDFRSIRPPPQIQFERDVPEAQLISPPRRIFATTFVAEDDPRPPIGAFHISALVSVNTERHCIYQTSSAALTLKPAAVKLEEFSQSLNDTVDMSKALVAEEEATPLNIQTWIYAAKELISIILTFDLPLPLMLPLQNGGIGAEWHESGLNIELRFRSPYQVYVVLEDARKIVPTLHDYDANLVRSRAALRELASR